MKLKVGDIGFLKPAYTHVIPCHITGSANRAWNMPIARTICWARVNAIFRSVGKGYGKSVEKKEWIIEVMLGE
jgi:hypothetical protein